MHDNGMFFDGVTCPAEAWANLWRELSAGFKIAGTGRKPALHH